MSAQPLLETAERINAHLRRFENDPKLNKRVARGGVETTRFYHASAIYSRRRVLVTYISYQGSTRLTADEAEQYLAWLDAGNVGRHFEALR